LFAFAQALGGKNALPRRDSPWGRAKLKAEAGWPSLPRPRHNLPMSRQLTKKHIPARRTLNLGNTMAFPRELRAAIPDLHAGRVLELHSITGFASHSLFLGRLVHLQLAVKETGRLSGKFVVGMALQIEAARQLAATLTRLADEAEKKEPIETRVASGGKRKP